MGGNSPRGIGGYWDPSFFRKGKSTLGLVLIPLGSSSKNIYFLYIGNKTAKTVSLFYYNLLVCWFTQQLLNLNVLLWLT